MQDIQNNSILIAPASLHPILQQELLQKKRGYLGVTLLTIEDYFLSQISTPEQYNDVLFQYRKAMLLEKENLHIYREICTQEHFLQQCMDALSSFKLYNLDVDSVVLETQEDKELNYILKVLYSIPLQSQFINQSLHSIRSEEHKIYLYPAFYTYEQSLLQEKLIKEGAVLLEQPVFQPEVSFYHATNMREEIEGLAQYIIHKKILAEDCTITICNAQYKHLINQIFQRYQIPFTLLSKTNINVPITKFCALLQYYLKPDKYHFLALLDCDVFPHIHTVSLRKYMELFQKDIYDEFQQIAYVQSSLLTAYDIEKLQKLRDEAFIAQTKILALLNSFVSLAWEEALIRICDMVKEAIHPKKDRKNYVRLQTYIQNVYPYLEHKDDLEFLLHKIRKLPSRQANKELQGMIVETLTTILPPRKHHFIVGATQADFPAFPLKKGIFDETYFSKLNYPTLQTRYDYHLQQVAKHYNQTEYLWISYPLGNYEGKGKEAALEVETFAQKKAISLPIQYTSKTYTLKTSITPQQAEALYLKNNVLYGSISSLEKYIKCPFSYYLKYGLHVKEPFQATFDDAKAGTLSHHILEILTQTYGKQYVDTKLDKIEELLIEEFHSLLTVFPNQTQWANVFSKRLLQNISQNLHVLKDMEQHSELSIFKTEYEFYHDISWDDKTLRLHGYIDRIDHKNEFMRILDYKSSPKSLVEHDVFAALQLQLITYGIVAQHDFQKKLLGVHYVSLKNENIPYVAGKMKRRPVSYIPLQKADYEESIYTAHRLQGWSLEDPLDMIDTNGRHIVGVTMNKSGEVKARKQYDMNVLKQHFETMYQTITNQIITGNISLTPDEFACTYCPYHKICRYKGFPHKKEPIIEVDERIYKQ